MNQDYSRYYKRFSGWTHKPTVRISWLISLTYFTVAFFGIFAIMPTFKTIAQLNKDINDSQAVSDQLSQKAVNLEIAQTNYNKIVNDLDLLDRLLPQKEEFETISWQLNWLASQKGITLTNGNFGSFGLVGAKTAGGLQSLEINLSTSAPYANTKDFLGALTDFDRLISIQEISLSNKAVNNLKNNQNVSATIKLTAYFLPKEGQ